MLAVGYKKGHETHLSFVFLPHEMTVKTTVPRRTKALKRKCRIRILSGIEYLIALKNSNSMKRQKQFFKKPFITIYKCR